MDFVKGQKVKMSQLSDVYDTHIILVDAHKTEDNDIEGTIGFIGKELTDESDKLFVAGANLCPIYKEKEYFDGDVCYDE